MNKPIIVNKTMTSIKFNHLGNNTYQIIGEGLTGIAQLRNLHNRDSFTLTFSYTDNNRSLTVSIPLKDETMNTLDKVANRIRRAINAA